MVIDSTNEINIDKSISLMIKKGMKFYKKDFAKASAITAVLFSAGVWLLKSIWYAYYSGRFSVYSIDRCYINSDDEGVFLQIIQMVAILILWLFLNVYYYNLLTVDKSSLSCLEKCKKIICFWAVEMLGVFIVVSVISGINILELIPELTVGYVIGIFLSVLAISVLLNLFAIVFDWERRKLKKKNIIEKKEQSISKNNRLLKYQKWGKILQCVVFIVAVELLVMYLVSINLEFNRHSYKVITVQNNWETKSKYTFDLGNESMNYEIYPIVFENQDCYIVSRLYQEGNKIQIEYDYQKVIPKEGVETHKISSVYQINELNSIISKE